MIRTTLASAILLAATVLGAGCQPRYDGVQIRFLFGDGSHASNRLEITEGQAVLIEVEPVSGNPYEDYENFDLVTLESFNENVLFLAPAPELDQFVLAGAGEGETVVRVSINGEQVDEIPAAVVGQVSP
ncbi:MAG: hypothetical protein AAF799_23830 [Myxococcota bacterium]